MSKKSNSTPFLLIAIVLLATVAVYGLNSLKVKKTQTDIPTVNEEKGGFIAGFPDFPIYPGSTIISSQKTGAYGTQPESYQAYLSTNEGVSKVITWYAVNLQKEGWTIERPPNISQASEQDMVVKKSVITATLNVEHENNDTSISINIQ